MSILDPVLPPPFNITRASHVYLNVRNLDESIAFYTNIIGLVLTTREGSVAYLRGIEEACHHSLVLRQAERPSVGCVGMRVATPADLDLAEAYFRRVGVAAQRIDRPHQGPTMLVSFDDHTPPIELCAGMPILPRLLADYPAQTGGKALRLDHYQCVVPDVDRSVAHLTALGFRPSKFSRDVESGKIVSIFLHRKNNPHDIVLARGGGPRLHHFAYIVSDMQAMLRACDLAAAYGRGRDVEHGIGRHGPPNGVFVYFRDPDGHRVEFGLPPMQYMDAEEVPNAWSSADGQSLIPWGAGPPQRWIAEASHFEHMAADDTPRWLPDT